MSLAKKKFGLSKQEVWQQLCYEMERKVAPEGGFWNGDKIVAMAADWTISLDTFDRPLEAVRTTKYLPYTRIRAPYENMDGFRFAIYRQGLFENSGSLFGVQDILIGEPWVDEKFVIQGNDPEKVSILLGEPKIKQIIYEEPNICLKVKPDRGWFATGYPDGVEELYFETKGIIKELDRLMSLYELFAEVLNMLCHFDSAYSD